MISAAQALFTRAIADGLIPSRLACAALLTCAVVLGAGPLSTAAPETISLPLAFAAGAVLASLADTLMPEAYEKGGPLVALSTTGGFVLSFVLSTL